MEKRQYRLRVIATDETRGYEEMSSSRADELNQKLRTSLARQWGVAELEWVVAPIQPPPSWGDNGNT